jgi:hypothetical protein
VSSSSSSTQSSASGGSGEEEGNEEYWSDSQPTSGERADEMAAKLSLLSTMMEMMAGEMREVRKENSKMRAKMKKMATKMKAIKAKQTQADLRSSLAFAQFRHQSHPHPQQHQHHNQHQRQHQQQHQHQHNNQHQHYNHNQSQQLHALDEWETSARKRPRYEMGLDEGSGSSSGADAALIQAAHHSLIPMPLIHAHSRSTVEETSRFLPFLNQYTISEHSFAIRDLKYFAFFLDIFVARFCLLTRGGAQSSHMCNRLFSIGLRPRATGHPLHQPFLRGAHALPLCT